MVRVIPRSIPGIALVLVGVLIAFYLAFIVVAWVIRLAVYAAVIGILLFAGYHVLTRFTSTLAR